jgi:hypothetical protein
VTDTREVNQMTGRLAATLLAAACLGVLPAPAAQAQDPWVVGCVDTGSGWTCVDCAGTTLQLQLRPELRYVLAGAITTFC